jgi:Fe-S cluster assembly scaffold protein SufB
MRDQGVVQELFESVGMDAHAHEEDVARIVVHGNQVVGTHLVPGLEVDAEEWSDGVEANLRVREGVRLVQPVQICFGMLPETGLQHIVLDIRLGPDADASVIAHCTFPNAREVEHRMNAEITVGPGAKYSYFERHVHGPDGGVLVVPKAAVKVQEGGRFKTEFELIKGRVGELDIDYDVECGAHGVADLVARINGRGDDRVSIRETGHITGEFGRAVLNTYIALRDRARAEVTNTLKADARGARGHVDCKEIVQDESVAKAVPIVEVNHPAAHVTHEAAIGSVDSKQLETLLARGLEEDDAVDLIIEGLLS